MSKLIRLHCFGGKEVLRTEELDVSQPDAGEVLELPSSWDIQWARWC
jgi:hypothetical protein